MRLFSRIFFIAALILGFVYTFFMAAKNILFMEMRSAIILICLLYLFMTI